MLGGVYTVGGVRMVHAAAYDVSWCTRDLNRTNTNITSLGRLKPKDFFLIDRRGGGGWRWPRKRVSGNIELKQKKVISVGPEYSSFYKLL